MKWTLLILRFRHRNQTHIRRNLPFKIPLHTRPGSTIQRIGFTILHFRCTNQLPVKRTLLSWCLLCNESKKRILKRFSACFMCVQDIFHRFFFTQEAILFASPRKKRKHTSTQNFTCRLTSGLEKRTQKKSRIHHLLQPSARMQYACTCGKRKSYSFSVVDKLMNAGNDCQHCARNGRTGDCRTAKECRCSSCIKKASSWQP